MKDKKFNLYLIWNKYSGKTDLNPELVAEDVTLDFISNKVQNSLISGGNKFSANTVKEEGLLKWCSKDGDKHIAIINSPNCYYMFK